MKKHALLKRATAVALLSATLATPAVVGLTGTAAAKPREGSCHSIALAIETSMYMADRARDQGETALAREYMRDAARASANYQRYCVT